MKNSFVVQYAVTLWVAAIGLTGFWATAVAFVASKILGSMLDRGLIVLDIQIDKLQEALKDEQWREAADKAYKNASKRVYDEAEKIKIRKQYEEILAAYATYGIGNSSSFVPDDKNT